MNLFRQWYKDKVVLVTGGTSGIGREMTFSLCAWGAKVIVCGRDASRLESLKQELGNKGHSLLDAFLLDLTNDELRQDMINTVKESYSLDVLINNAGLGYLGEFSGMSHEKIACLEKLNVQAVVSLTAAFIRGFKEKRYGGVLNVGSVASFFPTPTSALYCGTKHFILGFTDSLHCELLPYNIHVTGVYPGRTYTSFAERATRGAMKQWEKAVDPDVVAQTALEALCKNQGRVIPGWRDKLTVFISRMLPVKILYKLMARRMPHLKEASGPDA